jgi:hypothetical protein
LLLQQELLLLLLGFGGHCFAQQLGAKSFF